MKKGLVKLMAVVSTFAILLSQTVASANFKLTKDKVIDSAGFWYEAMHLMPGFLFDSANYSERPYGDNYGLYSGHKKWQYDFMNGQGWSLANTQNFFPIGVAGETDYSAVTDIQSFSEEKYGDYELADMEFWNGYMFLVVERVVWERPFDGDNRGPALELHSAIQVYDVANGGKAHVATWDFDDFDWGQADETMSYAVRDIEVTDDNIFVMLDMRGDQWRHEHKYNTQGGGVAVLNNNISRESLSYPMPTPSGLQNSEENGIVAVQDGMRINSEILSGAELEVVGDYLVYIPAAAGDNFAQVNEDSKTHGIWVANWTEPTLQFQGTSFGDWLDITFPENWFGAEYPNGTPEMKYIEIDGDYAYMDVVYSVADETSATGFVQYDKLYVIDVQDLTAPVITGETAPFTNPYSSFNFPIANYSRNMAVADGFVYIGQRLWNAYKSDDHNYRPHVYIVDVRNKKNPTMVQAIDVRMDHSKYAAAGAELHQDWGWGGIDGIIPLGDYLMIQVSEYLTQVLQLNADKTAILDGTQMQNITYWGHISGAPEPQVYGNRIFLPTVGGTHYGPNVWTEEVTDPVTGETTQVEHVDVDENGNWIGVSLDREHRYHARVEVIDFSYSLPMSIYITDVEDNGDETYTLSGTVRGFDKMVGETLGSPAIAIIDADSDAALDEYEYYVEYAELEEEVTAEMDVYGWSYTTEAGMPTNLVFALCNEFGEVYTDENGDPTLYETINLDMIGVEPVFTLTAEYSADAIAAGDFTVTAIATNTTAKAVDGVVIVAVYDADGKLVAVKTGEPETVKVGDEDLELAPVTVTVPAADSYDGYAVKTFLFNSVEGLAPACANLVF